MYRHLIFSVGLFFLFFPRPLHAQSSLHAAHIFGDNMVLQQGTNIPVWGTAKAGANVAVKFANYTLQTKADANGRWMVDLPLLTAGGPYQMTLEGDSVITFRNVMVGEVWLGSGQSNMNFRLNRPVLNSEEVIKAAQYPLIREFHVPETVSRVPLQDLQQGEWKVCSPETVGDFSAVGYFFARKLHLDQQVAVGIIHCSVSGTPAEAWLSADMLRAHPDFKNRIIDIETQHEDWAALQAENNKIAMQYQAMLDTTHAGLRNGVTKQGYDDSKWKSASYPLFATQLGVPGYKLTWVRKTFQLPASMQKRKLQIFLGEIKMQNITYINGLEVGRSNREEPIT
jgi:sialate O-acetylesterase